VVILVTVVVIVAVLIITMAVVVVVAPVFMMVIFAASVVSGAGSPSNFFDVGISVCYLYQFTDGCGRLTVQLAMELLVPEPFGESGDGLGASDVGNGISCLREAPNEVTQGLPEGLMKLL
jgi:hypothetical protein